MAYITAKSTRPRVRLARCRIICNISQHFMRKQVKAMMKFTRKIDFQSHFLSPAYYEFLDSEGMEKPDGFPTPDWDLDTQLEFMDTLGIGFAFLELSSPGLYTAQKEKTLGYVRRINEEAAEYVSRHPERLGFLGVLPLPHVEDSIREAVYALDTLHADGIGVLTNSGGVYLGDRRYDDLMKELDGRGALVVIHPAAPAVSIPNVCEDISIPAMEFFFETTRTFTNMVLMDTFARFPGIKWVVPHAGAFLSVLADRFESFSVMLRFDNPDRHADFMADMRHVYFDVAGFSEQKQVELLLKNVDSSHLLYGSDTPYTDIFACIGQTEALEQTKKLTYEQKQMIFTENALELVPRLKKITSLGGHNYAAGK